MGSEGIIEHVRRAAAQRLLYLPHLAIITAYIPSVDEWEADLRTRRSK